MGDSQVDRTPKFASGRLLARNSLLNFGSGSLMLVLNVLFVPAMLRSFGLELYGVLSVTWMVLGHLKWLDLGFSAACAKYVAQDLARGEGEHAGRWAWTAVIMQALVGILTAAVLWWCAPLLVDLLKIDPARRPMVVFALRMFALAVPFDLATGSLNAVLEAAQRFDWVNLLTLLGAAWTFSTYGIGIARDGDFRIVVLGLVAQRVVNLLATLWAAGRVLPSLYALDWLHGGSLVEPGRIREMFRFGGWVTVSSGIGPLIFFFDRWVISTARAVAVLPFYAVPLQMLVGLQLLPASATSTLFPAFSVLEANTRWDQMQLLVVRAHRYLLLALVPILLVLFQWAPEILRLWISADFSAHATLPFRILIGGFSIGLFAPFSGALLQGAGRPDVLSKVYLVEMPISMLLTVVLVREYGVVGAASVYTGRTIVETIILWICVHRVFPLSWRSLASGTLHRMGPVALGAALLLGLAPRVSIHSVASIGGTLGLLLVYSIYVHFRLLDEMDRSFIRGLLRRRADRIRPVAGSALG